MKETHEQLWMQRTQVVCIIENHETGMELSGIAPAWHVQRPGFCLQLTEQNKTTEQIIPQLGEYEVFQKRLRNICGTEDRSLLTVDSLPAAGKTGAGRTQSTAKRWELKMTVVKAE